MTRHYMSQEKPAESTPMDILDIMEKYESSMNKIQEGLGFDTPIPAQGPAAVGGPGAGPDMGAPAGQIMPPPAVVPPSPAQQTSPGAAGDAALSAPPEVAEMEPEEKTSGRSVKECLRTIRDCLMDLEVKLRELGALDEEGTSEEPEM